MKSLISFLQKEKLKNDIKMQYLNKGQSPSEKDLLQKIKSSEKDHKLGDPYFTGLKISPHEISNSTSWNRSFSLLQKDLNTLFEANETLNKQLISLEERSDLENGYYYSKANSLHMKLKRLQESLKKKNINTGFTESFMNFKNIDLSGTVEINLMDHSVSLEKSGGTKREKVEAVNTKIEPISPYESVEDFGDSTKIFSDFQNQNKILKYTTKFSGAFRLKISSELKAHVSINGIVLRMENAAPIKAALYLSEDGADFKKIHVAEGERYFEWNFKEQAAKAFYIVLEKASADGFENGEYEHQFIFKTLGFYKNIYERKGVFLSNEIAIKGLADKITIHSEDIVPQETSIKYSIGIVRNDGAVRWISAKKDEPVSLELLQSKDEMVNSIDQGYGEIKADGLYRIYKLPEETAGNTIKLYGGYQMWYAEKLKNIGGYDYTPSLSSYDASKISEKRVVDTENHRFSLESRDLEVLTQYVRVEKETILIFPSAFATGESERFKDVVYVNGIRIERDKGSFTIPLKAGTNKVIYLLYLESGPGQESYSASVITKINFRGTSDELYAFPEFKYLNPYALRNANLAQNFRYYTIEDGYVLVKHDPLEQKNSDGVEMRYYIFYRHLTKDSTYVFRKEKESFIKIKVKALLTSNSDDFSPRIMNYQLSSE